MDDLKYTKATGKIEQMNRRIMHLAEVLISRNPNKWPSKFILGEDWFSEVGQLPGAFMFLGERFPVEVVPGRTLVIVSK